MVRLAGRRSPVSGSRQRLPRPQVDEEILVVCQSDLNTVSTTTKTHRAQQRRIMKSSAQLERRRFERAPVTAQVEYELTNSSSGPSRVRRNMANVSLGGMFITTEEPIRVGTRMVVRFELPNHHRVKIGRAHV